MKLALMDNHLIVGVGNIYANEALLRAGIRPTLRANRVSLARYERLVDAVRETLADAIAKGGSTLRDYVDSRGRAGLLPAQLPRLRARGAAVPDLRHRNKVGPTRGPSHDVLPPLPALDRRPRSAPCSTPLSAREMLSALC